MYRMREMRATDICAALTLAFGCVGAAAPSIAEETTTDPGRGAVALACASRTACSSYNQANAEGGGVARLEPATDATNTGVPPGVAVTRHHAGTLTITADNTVVDGWEITGNIVVRARNVTIKNCKITFNGSWGIDAENAKDVTIQDSDFVGPGSSSDSSAAILGSGTFLRNDISSTENGIVLTGGASTVKGNYIHDLQDGGPDPHYDGISVQGHQNGVLIEGNTIIGRDTSDIFIKNDFGPISNVTISHNHLAGDPGWVVYVDARASGGPITGILITNNFVQKGSYGYYSVDKSSPVISDNIEFTADRR